jgi:DNA-binding IclR family transcriptional regulator
MRSTIQDKLSTMQNHQTKSPTLAKPQRRTGVQSIARAGSVLRALASRPYGIGLAELATAVELPKSTVHRLVGALASEELVSTSADGKIVLGGAFARLGAAGSRPLEDQLEPVLRALRETVDETVDLAVLDAGAMRFVAQLPAGHRLRAVSSVGARFPLHCTANGKALLAALPVQRALDLLPARLSRSTPHTISSRAALLAELEQVRARGVAFDREEHTEGIAAVGAAVLDETGPVAAISIPVPTARFAGSERRYAKAIAAAASDASGLLMQAPNGS